MPNISIKTPDGKTAKFTVPEGASQEDINGAINSFVQQYQQKQQSMAPPATQPPPAEQSVGAPAPPPAAGEAPMSQPPADGAAPSGTLDKLLGGAKDWAKTVYGVPASYYGGVLEGGKEAVRGVRQGFNALTGDQEELARLNQEQAQMEQEQAGEASEGTLVDALRGTGRAVGRNAPSIIGAFAPAGGLVKGASMLARAGAGAAGGAVGGAVGGATQALTPEEEAEGQRTNDATGGAIIGGLTGGTLPLAIKGGQVVKNALNRVGADEALTDFVSKRFGVRRGGDTLGNFKGLRNSINEKITGAKAKYSAQYKALEAAPGQPKVSLDGTAAAMDEISGEMSNKLLNELNPKSRRVVEALRGGSERTSPILDPTGKPMKVTSSYDLADVRDTVRNLRKEGRRLAKIPDRGPEAALMRRIEETLDSNLENWAAGDPTRVGILKQLRETDKGYASEVVPLQDAKGFIGKAMKKGDETALKKTFFGDNSGMALEDLLKRVPEAEGDVRALKGADLLMSRGPTTGARTLEGGTTNDVLLSQAERKYLAKVAENIRSTPHSNLGFDPSKLPLLRPIMNKLQGMNKFGEKGKYGAKAMSDALRGFTAGALLESSLED